MIRIALSLRSPKFVDCAIAANASFIVSEDTHFKILKNIPFPDVRVIRLAQFVHILEGHKPYEIQDSSINMVNEESENYNE